MRAVIQEDGKPSISKKCCDDGASNASTYDNRIEGFAFGYHSRVTSMT